MSSFRTLLFLPALTLLCWWYAWQLYQQARRPLRSPVTSTATTTTLDLDLTLPTTTHSHSTTTTTLHLDDQPRNMFHFMQISDIHVSAFRSHGALEHLKRFLKETLPAVKPQFVLVTGGILGGGLIVTHHTYPHEH